VRNLRNPHSRPPAKPMNTSNRPPAPQTAAPQQRPASQRPPAAKGEQHTAAARPQGQRVQPAQNKQQHPYPQQPVQNKQQHPYPQQPTQNRQGAEPDYSCLNQSQKQQYDTMQEQMRRYEGKSEAELLNEIKRMSKAGRENGTFDEKKLNHFANTISPMLNEEQKRRLQHIMQQINPV
jgi:hypothetical protein